MTLRMMASAALISVLAACGAQEEPDGPCCAIEPKHQCHNDLSQAGVTDEEVELLLGSADRICPSATLGEARIRELAAIWDGSPACETTRGYDRLRAMDAGLCSIRTGFDEPFVPEGVSPQVVTECATKLVGRGVTEPEFMLVMREPAAVCPNSVVSEERLREIIERDWEAAGCTQLGKAEMLAAMNTGACAKP